MLSSSFMNYSDSAQKKSNDTRHDLHSALLRTCVVRALQLYVHVSDELRAKRRRGSHSSMCVASAWLWQTLKGLARSYFSKSRAGAVLDSDSNILGRRTHAAPTHYLYIGYYPRRCDSSLSSMDEGACGRLAAAMAAVAIGKLA